MYVPGRNMSMLRTHLRKGFYGYKEENEEPVPPIDVPGCCRKADGEMNEWLSKDRDHVKDGLHGTIDNLHGWEAWTSTPETCLNIDDMEAENIPIEVSVVASEVDEVHSDCEDEIDEDV